MKSRIDSRFSHIPGEELLDNIANLESKNKNLQMKNNL